MAERLVRLEQAIDQAVKNAPARMRNALMNKGADAANALP